jgi:hypothetical protein
MYKGSFVLENIPDTVSRGARVHPDAAPWREHGGSVLDHGGADRDQDHRLPLPPPLPGRSGHTKEYKMKDAIMSAVVSGKKNLNPIKTGWQWEPKRETIRFLLFLLWDETNYFENERKTHSSSCIFFCDVIIQFSNTRCWRKNHLFK